MSDKERVKKIKEYSKIDEEANGIYVEPLYKDEPLYDFAGLREYCKKKGVKSAKDISLKEREMFSINV